MKLSAKQLERAALQLGARAVPDDHPVVSQLTQLYGDHTFFLDVDGLEIVETDQSAVPSVPAKVVKLANWADAKCTKLTPHEPQATDVAVDLDSED
jgi:hypothetical protein